ncbi:MAG TPA: hypothetical protein VHK88_00475 [Aquihabitans sp.]|nr:hypothetical protein [Aquihabitans sp.]
MQDEGRLEGCYDAETLAALDGWGPRPDAGDAPLPSKVVQWSRSSAMGAVLTGWALGLQEVLEPKRDSAIVIEVDADGEPHDLPIRLLLDPDDPSGSLCIVRRDPPPPVV